MRMRKAQKILNIIQILRNNVVKFQYVNLTRRNSNWVNILFNRRNIFKIQLLSVLLKLIPLSQLLYFKLKLSPIECFTETKPHNVFKNFLLPGYSKILKNVFL